jgi:hypothetical protein
MQGTLRTAHLVVGAIAIAAFLITGQLMGRHEPPVAAMEWGERLLFRSRHIYLLCGGLVSVALGIHYRLPDGAGRRRAAIAGSVLVLAAAPLLFFAFFSEPMANRGAGPVSAVALFALFGGVVLYAAVSLRRRDAESRSRTSSATGSEQVGPRQT